MRGFAVLASLFVFVLLLARAAGADVQPKTPSAALCLAVVKDVIPIDNGPDDKASLYAVTLQSLNGVAGIASGTLALYTERQRYDVPFKGAVAAGDAAHPSYPTMIFVRFPGPVTIVRSRVASLDGDGGGPCLPYTKWGHWVPSKAAPAGSGPELLDRATVQAKTSQPIPAPAPVDEPPRACDGKDGDATTIRPVTPPPQPYHPGSHVVEVQVFLTDDGTAAGAAVYKSSGVPDLDQATVEAALESTYKPEIRDCRAMGGTYIFRADFEVR
jgi:Gram-negative bacterial TonB protein C-terminal